MLGGLGAVFLMLVIGCGLSGRKKRENASCTRQIFALDTVMDFTAYGENAEEAVEAAVKEVERLDALWSAGNASGEISRINREGEGEISEDTRILLGRAREIYLDTGGLFDFTVYPLMELWGFPDRNYHVPSREEIEEVLPLADAGRVRLEGAFLQLGEGQQMDLGGIAKGYASGRVMDIFREYGITSGIVSLGGNVQTLGLRPDGKKWRVGIRDPQNARGEILAVLEAEDQAVITSGGYERYFEEDGETYIHIVNPGTGYPADGDLASVTVVSEDGTLADALSTALYLMDYEGAFSYWREHRDAFDMILIGKNGEIFVTEGLESSFRGEAGYSVLHGDGSRS